MPENKPPVVIVGAGPAGLTAAYELVKHDKKSVVLEADSQVGGLSRTITYKGYRFDIGGHRFFSKIPYVTRIWQEILGDDMVLRPRMSRIFYRKRVFSYPLKPGELLVILNPLESMQILTSYLSQKLFRKKREDNFEQWMTNRFGRRLYELFFKGYTEKVWGIPCSELSVDWAAQRIQNLSLKQAVRNAFLKTPAKKTIPSLIDRFYYPKYGPGMMWDRCRTYLADHNVPVLLNHRAERFLHDGKRVHTLAVKNNKGTVQYNADYFMSSMPLQSLICSLNPPPPADVLDAAHSLCYRDFLTVVLIVDKEKIFADNWIYIQTADVKMGRIQNYKNWSPAMVPDPAKTVLGLEYFLWRSDDEWSRPDEKWIDFGIQECASLGFIEPGQVLEGVVVRMPRAYPVYDVNYRKNVETIRDYLGRFENFYTIGRNGLHRYNNQDHSMVTGIYAARNVLGHDYDVWSTKFKL